MAPRAWATDSNETDATMDGSKLFRAGIVGTIVTAVCCSTPILAVVFGALGLTAWLSAADYLLIPALVAFVGLTGYATYRMRHGRRQCRRAHSGGKP